MDRVCLTVPFLSRPARPSPGEMGSSIMTEYVLFAVLAIVIFLSVVGDGAGRSEKRGRWAKKQ
jgi:hypothetical protein